MDRDRYNLAEVTAAGGEEQIVWSGLVPPVAQDAFGLVIVTRDGVEADADLVSVSADGSEVVYTAPADAPLQGGEVLAGRYIATRDWLNLEPVTSDGTEAEVLWASLDPPVAPDAHGIVVVTRDGIGVPTGTVAVSDDGTAITFTPPALYPLRAGEVLAGRYIYSVATTTGASDASKAAILRLAMALVRSPEGLSVSAAQLSDSALYAACEATLAALLHRHPEIGGLAGLVATAEGADAADHGTDVYHFARAVGLCTAAGLFAGVPWDRRGGVIRLQAEDASVTYASPYASSGFGGAGQGASRDLLRRCMDELSRVRAVAAARTAANAAFPYFGVRGRSRARLASATAPFTWTLHDLFGEGAS